jgi:hypothetical protein
MACCLPCFVALLGPQLPPPTAEELRVQVQMLINGQVPGAVAPMPVQAVELGKVYSLIGVSGIYSNFPPRDPNFFKGRLTNETFVEMVNIINESTMMSMVGLPRRFSPMEIPQREQLIVSGMMRGAEKVNEILRERRINCTFSFPSTTMESRMMGNERSTHTLKTTCQIMFSDVGTLSGSMIDPARVRSAMKKQNRKYAFMVSHAKSDAAAEATSLHEKLVELLGLQPDEAFLDSNNLKNIKECSQAAADSLVLILLQTKNTLTRPWVLAEIYSANDAGTKILPVLIEGKGYDFEASKQLLKSKAFGEELDAITPGATEELLNNGMDPALVGPILASILPYIISKSLNFASQREVRDAMYKSIVETYLESIENW